MGLGSDKKEPDISIRRLVSSYAIVMDIKQHYETFIRHSNHIELPILEASFLRSGIFGDI